MSAADDGCENHAFCILLKNMSDVKIYLVDDAVRSLHSRISRPGFVSVEDPTLNSSFDRRFIKTVVKSFVPSNEEKKEERMETRSLQEFIVFSRFLSLPSSLSSQIGHAQVIHVKYFCEIHSLLSSSTNPRKQAAHVRSCDETARRSHLDGIREGLPRIFVLLATSIRAANAIG